MIEVIIEESDRVDWALKAFKRKVQRAGILAEVRRRREYLKPSEARAKKRESARRRARSARRPRAA